MEDCIGDISRVSMFLQGVTTKTVVSQATRNNQCINLVNVPEYIVSIMAGDHWLPVLFQDQ